MRFGVDIIDRSEGQALLPPEPGLRRSLEYPDRISGGGIMAALTSSHCRRAHEGREPHSAAQEAYDAPMATTPRMKITYATLSADNEELQSSFDAALERALA